jgi:hypothetical protein
MKITLWAVALFLLELALSHLPNNDFSIRILSPLAATVLHTSECFLAIHVHPGTLSPGRLLLAVFVNDTEVLRAPLKSNEVFQPTVTLSGLDPGVCVLFARLIDSENHDTVAEDTTTILISSASVSDGPEASSKVFAMSEGDYAWHAVAVGSDDWGRTADMIPLFASLEALEEAEKQGWIPGAWGRATTETAKDMYS